MYSIHKYIKCRKQSTASQVAKFATNLPLNNTNISQRQRGSPPLGAWTSYPLPLSSCTNDVVVPLPRIPVAYPIYSLSLVWILSNFDHFRWKAVNFYWMKKQPYFGRPGTNPPIYVPLTDPLRDYRNYTVKYPRYLVVHGGHKIHYAVWRKAIVLAILWLFSVQYEKHFLLTKIINTTMIKQLSLLFTRSQSRRKNKNKKQKIYN